MSMHILPRRRYFSALAVVPILAAGLGIWLFVSAQTSPPGDTSLSEPVVSSIDLDLGSVTVEEAGLDNWLSELPPDVQPEVTREEAEQVAREHSHDTSGIRDAVFAHAETSSYNCRSCDVWLFSYNVDSADGHGPSLSWYVVAVDAYTGEYLFGTGACLPTERTCE